MSDYKKCFVHNGSFIDLGRRPSECAEGNNPITKAIGIVARNLVNTKPDYSSIPDDRKRQLDALGEAGAMLGIFDAGTLLDLGEFLATAPKPTQGEIAPLYRDCACSDCKRPVDDRPMGDPGAPGW